MKEWPLIDDRVARQMLTEIYEQLGDDDLFMQYATALELCYRKPEGTISNYIFYQDLSVEEIVRRLNEDTVTYL